MRNVLKCIQNVRISILQECIELWDTEVPHYKIFNTIKEYEQVERHLSDISSSIRKDIVG
jgi:5-methylthioribose kinase